MKREACDIILRIGILCTQKQTTEKRSVARLVVRPGLWENLVGKLGQDENLLLFTTQGTSTARSDANSSVVGVKLLTRNLVNLAARPMTAKWMNWRITTRNRTFVNFGGSSALHMPPFIIVAVLSNFLDHCARSLGRHMTSVTSNNPLLW